MKNRKRLAAPGWISTHNLLKRSNLRLLLKPSSVDRCLSQKVLKFSNFRRNRDRQKPEKGGGGEKLWPLEDPRECCIAESDRNTSKNFRSNPKKRGIAVTSNSISLWLFGGKFESINEKLIEAIWSHSCFRFTFCLRPSAKDQGITWVVLGHVLFHLTI